MTTRRTRITGRSGPTACTTWIYGSPALVGGDLTKLNVTPGADPGDPAQYDYWDHVDYVVDTAAANGIYVAMAPVWSHMVRRTPLTAAQVGPYIEQVARRYKDRANVIWLNGGSGRGHENSDVWKVIGDTLLRQNSHQLVSFHPFGRTVTTEWFKDAAWLDFHMFTSGHRRYDQDTEGRKYGEDNWRFIMERLETDGARQMTHLKTLVLSRPFFERVNDQSLVAGDEGEKYDRVLVARGTSYLFAYTYTGRSFTLQPGALTGERLRVSWFNPRTGETTAAGTMAKARSATFDPPGEPAPGNDWVLILDDAAREYPTPAKR